MNLLFLGGWSTEYRNSPILNSIASLVAVSPAESPQEIMTKSVSAQEEQADKGPTPKYFRARQECFSKTHLKVLPRS